MSGVNEALSAGLLTTDASRRVGWAKAYAAQQLLADRDRDLNVSRSEREIMRKAVSYLYGFISQYAATTTSGDAEHVLSEMVRDYNVVIDGRHAHKGRRAGATLRRKNPDDIAAKHDDLRNDSHRHSARLFQHARKSVFKALARDYGFSDVSTFIAYLDMICGTPDQRSRLISLYMEEQAQS